MGPSRCCLLALVLVFCATCAAAWTKPDWCGNQECPKFEEKGKGHGYVTRKYESATWVMAHHCNPDPVEAAKLSVAQLMRYFWGVNEQAQKVVPGVPVAYNISFHHDENAASMDEGPVTDEDDVFARFGKKHKKEKHGPVHLHVHVYMYLPSEYQEGTVEPPTPSSEKVHITTIPEWTAYVADFDGFSSPLKFAHAYKGLEKELHKHKEDHEEGWVMFVEYNPPWQLEHRRNEVWIAAHDSKDSNEATLLQRAMDVYNSIRFI